MTTNYFSTLSFVAVFGSEIRDGLKKGSGKHPGSANYGRFASGSGFAFPIRIRLQESQFMADPDSQHWIQGSKRHFNVELSRF
jgi:hypothetical protein